MNPPEPIGSSHRPTDIHNRMWALYVYDGLSAKVTAEILNGEIRGCRETAGSVVGYALRQDWNKAGLNGLVVARQVTPPPVTLPPPKVAAPAPNPEAPRPVAPKAKREPMLDDIRLVHDGLPPDFTVHPVCAELHHLQCKWPVGVDPGRTQMHLQKFCGAERFGEAVYCRAHQAKAYPPSSAQGKAARHAAQDRPAR